MSNELNEGHAVRMARKKSVIDRKIEAASTGRGVLLVHTGNGKGKSTAAFGIVARAVGHGIKVSVVQFVKSRTDTGEEACFRQFGEQIRWQVMGNGFTWENQNRESDCAAARAAWETARLALSNPEIGLVVLDELTFAFKYAWLELGEVLTALARRPPMQHVIVTGRTAPLALIEAADTVSEMRMAKHAFQQGVRAMPGIEY